ncbi:MAG: hypothetical protein IH968_15870 [Gemmatimonadetes bacterium]|nr:hypothetical protein [Gemmatimonadota bacterium]
MARRIPTGLEAREGRKFGLTVGTAFLVLGGIALWRGRELPTQILWGLGGLLILGAALLPAKLKPVERAWMAMALQISRVMTPIVMGIVYFLVLTPIALVIRSAKGNPLVHRTDATGYWFTKGEGQDAKSDMRRQF